jgi:hypothetical protein
MIKTVRNEVAKATHIDVGETYAKVYRCGDVGNDRRVT